MTDKTWVYRDWQNITVKLLTNKPIDQQDLYLCLSRLTKHNGLTIDCKTYGYVYHDWQNIMVFTIDWKTYVYVYHDWQNMTV